jgi:kojibiose phosphorylase
MFLYTQPDVARSILKYRYDTLDGARGKAKRLGYYGAFYAWTSGKTGEELFPDYFFTNVLTGRKMRNHFNDWQIHISPDIVYALWQYYAATGDWDFIADYGAEVAFEVAQFLVSRIHFKMDKDRYEFIRLLGPDEYHENVDNNAFTNYQARFALEKALVIYELMRESTPDTLDALCERLGLSEAAVESWRDIVDRIYLPQPDPDTLLIEQCDGFFELEDVRPEDLRERLLHPEEYWGWPSGVAVETQVQKQADVLQLLALHDLFPVEVVRANYDYYEPRTEHGSSLSPSVHSLIASRAGYAEEAYRYFQEAATIDLYNASKKVMSGGSFLGGIHTAACGAVWQMIVFGFAGFTLEEPDLRFQPALPEQWESVSFTLVVWGNVLAVEILPDRVVIRAQGENEDALPVTVGDQSASVAPGETQTFM